MTITSGLGSVCETVCVFRFPVEWRETGFWGGISRKSANEEMKGGGGWVQRLRQKAEREIIDFRAGGSWEIYRNNNNEHGDTLVKGERPQLWIRDWTCAPRGFFPSLSSLNLQFNSRISDWEIAWVSRYHDCCWKEARVRSIRCFWIRRNTLGLKCRGVVSLKECVQLKKCFHENELHGFHYIIKIIMNIWNIKRFPGNIKRVKNSIFNRKASYAQVIMIYVVRYRFFARRNTKLDNVCEKSIAIKSLTRKIIERCSTFILARIFPLKVKTTSVWFTSRPRDLGFRLFYKKAEKRDGLKLRLCPAEFFA